jgi:hypothetical protein
MLMGFDVRQRRQSARSVSRFIGAELEEGVQQMVSDCYAGYGILLNVVHLAGLGRIASVCS